MVVFIVGNGLCAVPENVRQITRNDTQVVPYKVFAFYTNTSINPNLKYFILQTKGSHRDRWAAFYLLTDVYLCGIVWIYVEVLLC